MTFNPRVNGACLGKTVRPRFTLSRFTLFPIYHLRLRVPFLGTRADLLFLPPILTNDRYREGKRGVLARALNLASSLRPLLFPSCGRDKSRLVCLFRLDEHYRRYRSYVLKRVYLISVSRLHFGTRRFDSFMNRDSEKSSHILVVSRSANVKKKVGGVLKYQNGKRLT